MAAVTFGLLSFIKGQSRHLVPVQVSSLPQAVLLAQELAPHTTAYISHAYCVTFDTTGYTEEPEGEIDNIEVYAKVEFEIVNSESPQARHYQKIAAPNLEDFEGEEEIGYWMKEEVGAELAQKIGDVMGIELQFIKGDLHGGGYFTR